MLLKIGPRLVQDLFPSFPLFLSCLFGMFKITNSVNWCKNSVFFCKIARMSENEVSEKNLAFFIFSFFAGERQTDKKKTTKKKIAKMPRKIILGVVMKKVKIRKMFCKYCQTLFVFGREKKGIFMHNSCFAYFFGGGGETGQTRKHYKNSGLRGNCPKPEMTHF